MWDSRYSLKKFYSSLSVWVAGREKWDLTSTRVGGERKCMFVKYYMTRKIKTVGLEIETLVSILSKKIAEENTRGGFWIKLTAGIWLESWIA